MNTILVPIDFCETSDNALDYAVSLANFLEGSIILLHVDSARLYNFDSTILTNTLEDILEKSVVKLKEKALKIRKENIRIPNINYYVEGGDLKSTILEYITNYRVDYVVMGTSRPETNRAKEIFGTMGLPISKNSEAPVFIIPKDYRFKKIKNIAYASEYSNSIKEHNSLFQVKYITKAFGAFLNVLHVIPENHTLNKIETEADLFVEEVLENTSHKTFILSSNNTSEALLNFIKTNEIDLIVLEPKKHSFFHNLFYPSTTKEITFETPIPVLTLRS